MSSQQFSHAVRQQPALSRVLVCGDRNWADGGMIEIVLRKLQAKQDIAVVIEGECRGADALARHAAETIGIPVLPFPADWTKYGGAAGPIRNQQMLDEGKPDVVLAFHDCIKNSAGTLHMIRAALKRVGEVRLYGHITGCGPGGYSEQILRAPKGFDL